MSRRQPDENLTFYIDTGGTFTDAFCADSEGRIISRLKILSNSSLRGEAELINRKRLKIRLSLDTVPAEQFFSGCEFIPGSMAHGRSKVEQVTGLLSGLTSTNSIHK